MFIEKNKTNKIKQSMLAFYSIKSGKKIF